jgi:molecular chaperone GrpE
MIQDQNPSPLDPDMEPQAREGDLTVDLTIDDSEEVGDLQALADEVAEVTPEPSPREAASDRPLPSGDVTDRIIEELERELEEATAKLHQLEKRETEYLDKHHRLLADFANYRNRTGRDIQMAVDLSERKLLMEMLPVMDNFERCIGASYVTVEDCRNGVALIKKQFMDALRRIGVEEIGVKVGDPFDAQHAEALTTTSDPTLSDGAIASIFERGFMLRDQLLRAARVVVNHHPEGTPGLPEADAPANLQ